MKISEAHQLLEKSMAQHGLTTLGWTAQLDHAKRRFGFCDTHNKVISLSRPLSEANPEDEVYDTILHEIAHALAFIEHNEDCAHDERWKAICRQIGARPETCYSSDEVILQDAPWVLTHIETGEIFHSYVRKPNKDFSTVWIRGRKDETLGKLEIKAADLGPIKKFTRPTAQQLNRDILAAIETLLQEKGLSVEMTNASFSDFECNFSCKVRAPLPDGKTPEQAAFEEEAMIFGLSDGDYRKVFRSHGKSYLLCGIKPNNRKYPIIGLCPTTGKRFKFEFEVLDSLSGNPV